MCSLSQCLRNWMTGCCVKACGGLRGREVHSMKCTCVFLNYFSAVHGELPNDSNLLGLDFLICLNLVVSTMNNRTQFQWWFLRGGIPKIKLCNCPLQKYSNSLSIWYEFDRFPLCPVFPYPTFSLLFREMQFSHCDSLFDLDFLFPLCLCQLKHASGCAYDIFSEIHCVRDGDRLPHCFSCLLSSLLYNPTLSLLWSLCVWHFLKRSFIHLGYFNV